MADVVFLGGPYDGLDDSSFSSVLLRVRPAYFCCTDPDTALWHHYSWVPTAFVEYAGGELVEYSHNGLCDSLSDHPVCGHDHAPPPAPVPPANHLGVAVSECCADTGFADFAAVACPNPFCPQRTVTR